MNPHSIPIKTSRNLRTRTTQPYCVLVRAVTLILIALPFLATAQPTAPTSTAPAVTNAAAILQELRSFRQMGTVLLVAAHPDDEDSSLIAYLARGRYCRTGYLSITRGDGGQNVLGPEFGAELGVIRTQELLAARRIDGGVQFFTRARDFGYSKDYRDTLKKWGEQDVLSDVVRVIRTFQPDVVISVFSTNPAPNQHGHHTASAILAGEAFKLAGDPTAFPDQLHDWKPWQPKRLLQDRGRELTMQVGAEFSAIASRSRSMHKTQGFDNFGGRGGGASTAGFTFLAGAPATNDIFDGIDTTWSRIPGGAQIGPMTDDVIAHFDPAKPDASVPALIKIHHLLASLPLDRLVDEKRRQLVHILQECIGLSVETTTMQADVVPGEMFMWHHAIIVNGDIPVRWLGVNDPENSYKIGPVLDLLNTNVGRFVVGQLASNTPITQPYWLREEGSKGLFRVDDASLIGQPGNLPVFPIEEVFDVEGEKLLLPNQISLRVIPPVSLKFLDDVELFPSGAARSAIVEITAARSNLTGTLRLDLPAAWRVTPPTQSFSIATPGGTARSVFTITAPPQAGTAEILAVATVGGVEWHTGRVELKYDHIPPQLLQPPARLKALSLDLAIRGHKVGYIPGAGDDIAAALSRMGYEVTTLTGADLTPEKLSGLDAVVTGVRAFNVRTDLAPRMSALFEFATNGGNVIVLYNRPQGTQPTALGLTLGSGRVTDFAAEMTLLVPDHPAFNTPNKIVPADFDGWVQERGIYFPSQWDPQFTALLSCHDAGDQPLKGSLLVAQCGKGNFVYTSLSWFRQLPDGVPGAYRLFANLVSLGK